jgi:hypothetical protein
MLREHETLHIRVVGDMVIQWELRREYHVRHVLRPIVLTHSTAFRCDRMELNPTEFCSFAGLQIEYLQVWLDGAMRQALRRM